MPGIEFLERRRVREHFVEQAEPLQHVLPGALEDDPRADRPEFCGAFEERDAMAVAREQVCRGRTGHPEPHHSDVIHAGDSEKMPTVNQINRIRYRKATRGARYVRP